MCLFDECLAITQQNDTQPNPAWLINFSDKYYSVMLVATVYTL
jgi:hypothetical protein